jgi:periplasmic protein TonB
MDVLHFDDDPRRRLPGWVVLASLLTFGSLMGFMRVLEGTREASSPPRFLDVQILEPPPRAAQNPAAVPAAPTPVARIAKRVPPPPTPMNAPPKPVEAVPHNVESPPPSPAATAAPPEPATPEVAVTPPVTLPRADVDERPAPRADALPAPSPVVPVNPARPSTTQREPTGPAARQGLPPALSTPPSVPTGSPGAATSGTADGLPGGGNMGARAIVSPLPEIPESLRRRNLELVAIARFRVAANGNAQVELTQPTSEPDLNRALIESLRRWRFFPAMRDGKPVDSVVDIRVPISVR